MIKLIIFFSLISLAVADWNQGGGPNFNYTVKDSGPQAFSVSVNKGIQWAVALPETGQSSPVIVGDKIFLTCFTPVTKDSKAGLDILALCYSTANGRLLWQREMKGSAPSKISGCFGDNSGPAPVSDGKTVCFLNASGLINNYDFAGNLNWSVNVRTSRRVDPFLLNGTLIVTGSAETDQMKGRHITAIDFKSGKVLWKSDGYCWNGVTMVPYKRANGEWVGLIGRGGGHIKDEYKKGFELISLKNGKTLWNKNLEGFQSTQNITLKNDSAYLFLPKGKHIVVKLENGEIIRVDDIQKDAELSTNKSGSPQVSKFTEKLDLEKQSITQMSNLLCGKYHFFRTYRKNFLGRLNIQTGKTEYLELPTQIERNENGVKYCWSGTEEGERILSKKKKELPLQATHWILKANSMKNNANFTVVGDGRSKYSGWGHVSAALPTVIGDLLYVPTMSGLVYILKWNEDKFDHRTLVSISDLGPLGESWTRSSVTYSNGKLYGRTIKQLICISGCKPEEL